MSEDTKRNQDKTKKKNDPKEQRKPRNSRKQEGKLKAEIVDESKSAQRVPQKPPVYEDPGPGFYQNLKRETEEILKITKEEHSKYKKKEIQSNWSKYELPIESYEEIEEHNVGADYAKLIQAPLSIGGHFQFKHEKSWDVNTGPSLYDKYFDINMDSLFVAVSTLPFFKRNGIEESLFSETDIVSMNTRATKYKQKYYDDKSYATPETEAQDRVLNSLKESFSNNKDNEKEETVLVEKENEEIVSEIMEDKAVENDDINLDFRNLTNTECLPSPAHRHSNKLIKEKDICFEIQASNVDDTDVQAVQNVPEINHSIEVNVEKTVLSPKETIVNKVIVATQHSKAIKKSIDQPITVTTACNSTDIRPEKAEDNLVETKKCPVIESPEDLEMWLDNFLDG